MGASSSGPANAVFLTPRKALWPSHTILIRPVTGAMRVAINGQDHEKPMTADQMVDLAHQILGRVSETRRLERAARETERVG